MPELLGKGREAKEAIERIDFVPDAIDQVGSEVVIRGRTPDGKPSALRLGIELFQYILSELQSQPDTSVSGGVISDLRSNVLSRFIGKVAMAGSLALGATACTSEDHGDKGSYSSTYGTQESALTTYDQMLSVGKGQPIPGTQTGEGTSNFATINGEKYFLVNGGKGVVYVECDKLIDCMNLNSKKNIKGLNNGNPPLGPLNGPGIYQDNKGNKKFLVSDGKAYEGDIAKNATGELEVNNMLPVTPKIPYNISIFDYNGAPHALYTSGFKNLWTGANNYIDSLYNDAMSCGPATFDGQVAVGAKLQKPGGVDQCLLITAKTLEELATKPTFLTSLNSQQASKMLRNPRLASDGANGSVLVYSVGQPGQEKLWYAVIPPAKATPPPDATGDTTPDAADAGSTDAPDAQDSAVQDSPDAQDSAPEVEDSTAVETALEVTAAVDAVVDIPPDVPPEDVGPDVADVPPELPPEIAEPDNGPETAPDLPPDVADVPPDVQSKPELSPDAETTPDTGPDVSPELPPKDTAAPDVQPDTTPEVAPNKCDFAKAKIKVKIGDCALENCQNPIADINGKCTVEIDLGNAKPVVLEVNGKYSVDLLEEFGTLLAGKFKVIDDGNAFNTVTGNFGTGVEGTTYSGELPDDMHYSLSCQEGRISVYWMPKGAEKQLLGTLDGGQSQTFEIKNPQPIPKADAGQAEPSSPDAGSKTPETTAADAGKTPETTAADAGKKLPVETPRPPDDGCSVNNGSNKGKSHLSVLALTLLGAASMMRRKRTAKVTA